MDCTIAWNTLSPAQWEENFRKIPYSNLLQSYDYARAVCPVGRQKARWGLIRFNGRDAGMVQVLEAGILFNALHAVILDRGPLWFEGFGGAAHIKLFFDCFNREFPQRLGRRRRILPEIEDGLTAQKILQGAGLRRVEDRKGYETVWLDLRQETDAARAALKANWRNKLSKAERAVLTVDWDHRGLEFPALLDIYARDKKARGYDGPSPKLLSVLARHLIPQQNMVIGTARLDGERAAMIMMACHGRSATYLVGWTSDEGRKTAAHHRLLWSVLDVLKEKGISELDLGGVNDDSAQGVKTFKEGMGGRTVRYAGHFI